MSTGSVEQINSTAETFHTCAMRGQNFNSVELLHFVEMAGCMAGLCCYTPILGDAQPVV